MDSRIDAIYGRQSIDKKTVSALKVSLNFAAMSLKAVRVRNTKTRATLARTLSAPTSSGFCRTSGWA